LSHQRGKPKKQKQTKETEQNIPHSNAIQFQLELQRAVLVQSLSHQRKRKEKKKGLETVL
jgi:hypothetical protein